MPAGFGVRWDGGYETGDEISQYYDNLVGKLIVLGRATGRRAIARMHPGAARRSEIEGIATTIPADLAILEHPDFAGRRALHQVGRGRCSTSPASAAAAGRRRPTATDAEPKVQRATSTSRSTASASP